MDEQIKAIFRDWRVILMIALVIFSLASIYFVIVRF